ncbi:unnamed protein product, partial [Polarella glacialis]
ARPEEAEPRAVLACADVPLTSAEAFQDGHGPLPEHPEVPSRVGSCISRLKNTPALWNSL